MFDDEATIERDASFGIGRVTSVEGRRIRVSVDKTKNSSHLLYKGSIVRNVSVGGFIKIAKGFVELVGVVDGERVTTDAITGSTYRRGVDSISRDLDVSLIGYFANQTFVRGIKEMPLLDNECFLLTEPEFRSIHTFSDDEATSLTIGTLAMEPTHPVSVGVDAIFASHIGIFGNTGSGKSYTLAKIYHELFDKYAEVENFRSQARFVLIDFNGEYISPVEEHGHESLSTSVLTATANKREFALTTHHDDGPKLPLPTSAVSDPLFWTVLLDATEKTQAPFLNRVLQSTYWERHLGGPGDLAVAIADMITRASKSSDVTVDRQTILNLLGEVRTCLGSQAPAELQGVIEDFQQNLGYNATLRKFFWGEWRDYVDADHVLWQSHTSDKVSALPIDFSSIAPGIDLVRFKIVLQYYDDIISGHAQREHLSPLIKRMETRVPDIKKLITVSDTEFDDSPLCIVGLRDVNLAMRKVIPMLLCKHLYDMKKIKDPRNSTYLNLIIDEAHNILSLDSTRESEAWRDYRLETFEEIIKEGRKFGVFLTIASQRPHDISPTIISQLHNYFLHRLVNDLDIRAIEKAVSYLDRVSFESLPILPTGVCVLAGVSAQIPVIIKVGELAPQFAPNSRTLSIASAWRVAS